jgi:hypothetical protein
MATLSIGKYRGHEPLPNLETPFDVVDNNILKEVDRI